jgi:hypothetical protein
LLVSTIVGKIVNPTLIAEAAGEWHQREREGSATRTTITMRMTMTK